MGFFDFSSLGSGISNISCSTNIRACMNAWTNASACIALVGWTESVGVSCMFMTDIVMSYVVMSYVVMVYGKLVMAGVVMSTVVFFSRFFSLGWPVSTAIIWSLRSFRASLILHSSPFQSVCSSMRMQHRKLPEHCLHRSPRCVHWLRCNRFRSRKPARQPISC